MNIKNFGNYAIDITCYNKILEILPENSTILELGSGTGTKELAKRYIMYSIEHNEKWLNKFNSTYIYAPLKPLKQDSTINWYDVEVLKKELPEQYDLILIDGPPAKDSQNRNSRDGFMLNLNLFNINVPIVFDDVHRKEDYDNFMKFVKLTNRKYEIFNGNGVLIKKQFAIVY